MIQFDVSVTDGLSPMLRELISSLSGPQAEELNEVAGHAAVLAAIRYHREFDQSGGWKGKRYLGPGPNDGSDFGADVARGWHFVAADKDGATIRNEATYYAFKVRGGTITPKRAKALTIPLIREAKGLYASVYQQNTGHRLFTIKGKHALFERMEGSTTGARGRRGRPGTTAIRTSNIRAVYALVASVTMGPWPGAVPDEKLIGNAYAETYLDGLEDIIAKS
jgi:hypothetical protein